MMGGQLMLGAITIPLGKLFDLAPPLITLLVALLVGICAIPAYFYGNLNIIGVSVVLGTLIAGQARSQTEEGKVGARGSGGEGGRGGEGSRRRPPRDRHVTST